MIGFPAQPAHDAFAFGLRWRSDVPLAPFTSCQPEDRPADIQVARASGSLLPRDISVATAHLGRARDGLRYTADDTATIDTYGARRIEIHPGAAWNGELPPAFFGTVTGLLLAWRGLVPLHASAVELDGRAVVLCGPSGAGKSTLAAALIAQGARLISDDLTVLHPASTVSTVSLFAGRRNLRLFPEIADLLGRAVAWASPPVVADRKLAVTPPRVDPRTPVPLAAVIVLGEGDVLDTPERRADELTQHFFRPRWMRTIPGHRIREAVLSSAARDLEMFRAGRNPVADAASFSQWGKFVVNAVNEKLLEHA